MLTLLALALQAVPPASDTLLADLNKTQAQAKSSGPRQLASDGDVAWFSAIGPGGLGRELWRSDGTSAGTQEVADLWPGLASGMNHGLFAAPLPGGRLVFAGTDGVHGFEPWVSDGTSSGTQLLADIHPGAGDSQLTSEGVSFGGEVFFLADSPTTGRELWRTDGTSQGTQLAVELAPGPESGFAGAGLVPAATQLFVHRATVLSKIGGTFEFELFAGDGTQSGGALVKTFAASQGGFAATAVLGDSLFFEIRSGADRGWWVSDGTSAGTLRIAQDPGPWAVAAGGQVYLATEVSSVPPSLQLLVSNGTAAGTLPADAFELSTGSLGGGPPAAALGGGLIYAAKTPGFGVEPAFTAGAAGTGFLLADLAAGAESSNPENFVVQGGLGYFTAETSGLGREPYVTDGVSAQLLADLGPGGATALSQTLGFAPCSQGVLFSAEQAPFGSELYLSEPSGSGLLADLNPDFQNAGAFPDRMVRLGNLLIFRADDGIHGEEPWVSDGTAAGTTLLADLRPGPEGSDPFPGVVYGDRMYFSAETQVAGVLQRELWATDGTSTGTQLFLDLNGAESSTPNPHVVYDGRLFFVATDSGTGREVWKTDGSASGSELLADITVPGGLGPNSLTVLGDRLLFQAGGIEGSELWESDGTEAGTKLLVDANPGPDGSFPRDLTVLSDRLVFRALTANSGFEPWVSDGTSAGTFRLADIGPGEDSGAADSLVRCGDGVIFIANDGVHGEEPWFTDGTSAGTKLLLDVAPGSASANLNPIAGSENFAVLARSSSFQSTELWTSDGTSSGTQVLFGEASGLSGFSAASFVHPAGRVLFRAFEAASGFELWSSDGTLAGTFQVTDSGPGPLSGLGSNLPPVRLAQNLVFAADDGSTGLELHSAPYQATGDWAIAQLGSGCAVDLQAEGVPTLGNTFDLRLEGAAPGGVAVFFYGTSFLNLNPFGSCAALIANPTFLATAAADAQGNAAIGLSVPVNPGWIGQLLHFQALAFEVGGPFLGLGRTTGALEVLIGG